MTKEWAFQTLQGADSRELCRFFGLEFFFTFAVNSGAAWGFMSSFPMILLFIRFLFVAVLLFTAIFCRFPTLAMYGIALILSGAISNILDFFLYGAVVDMIHVRIWGYDYPIFNIADSCITGGAILFLISAWQTRSSAKQKK